MDIFRWLLSALFGVRWVALLDTDGEFNIRLVRWRGGQACAKRYSYRLIQLLDGGEVRGVYYVKSWRPHLPLMRGDLPTPPIGDGWQPIADAPDDTRLWLYHVEFPVPANHMSVGMRYQGSSVWVSETLGKLEGRKAPTHFRLLPTPPKQGDGA